MAVDWMDGVAHYGPIGTDLGRTLLTTKWTINIINSATLLANAGPRNNQVIVLGSVGITRSHQQHFIWGFRYGNFSNRQVGAGSMLTCQHVGSLYCEVFVEADSTISIYAGNRNTLIANSGGLSVPFKMQPLTYYYFELEVICSGGSQCSVQMNFKVNGVQIMGGSGNCGFSQSALLLNQPTCNFFIFTGVGGPSYMCDVQFTRCDGTGLINTFSGDVEIGADFPDADVAEGWQTTGTPHYKQINESIPDFDTTYISANTIGVVDSFNFQPISPFQGQILAVHYLAFARKDDEGTKEFTLLVSGNVPTGCPTFSPSDEYIYFTFCMDADPDTGIAWTQAGFNAKVFGVKLIA